MKYEVQPDRSPTGALQDGFRVVHIPSASVATVVAERSTADLICNALNQYKDQTPDENMAYMNKTDIVTDRIKAELYRAKTLFPAKFVNQHEAYAVILEEMDELWDEIKKNQKNYDYEAQRKEATQLAAMVTRLLVELL
jgi:hypothetical protein